MADASIYLVLLPILVKANISIQIVTVLLSIDFKGQSIIGLLSTPSKNKVFSTSLVIFE
jgi:hypothetical protein